MPLRPSTRSCVPWLAAALLYGCAPSDGSKVHDQGDATGPGMNMDGGPMVGPGMDGGPMVGPDVGPGVRPDVGPGGGPDVGPGVGPDGAVLQCQVPLGGTACSHITQMAMPVTEMQVATAPPPTTAGWYPAGTYLLTSSTVYTGPGGASGPSGLRYAMTLQVNGMGSVDFYQFLRTQPGCADATFTFSGDTFGATSTLSTVTWMCPTCATCAHTMPFTGTLTSLILYFPLANGNTLAQTFTVGPSNVGGGMCGNMGQPCCDGGMCAMGTTCNGGLCGPGGSTDGGMPCGAIGQPCCGGGMCGMAGLCVDGRCGMMMGPTDGGGMVGPTDGGGMVGPMGEAGACGGMGYPCCAGGTCHAGFTCVSGYCHF